MIKRLLQHRSIERCDFREYRKEIQRVYAGPKGALLATLSLLSLHIPLIERLIRRREFDLRGARRILDVGTGAGQLLRHVVRYSDPEAEIFGIDLSLPMLKRAGRRLPPECAELLGGSLAALPFADETFDCLTCGYVLEHLPSAEMGLTELRRVMRPGARMLLITSEDTLSGAWTSRAFLCRTYRRQELREVCQQLGLLWHRELWFSRIHRRLGVGGICVELRKPDRKPSVQTSKHKESQDAQEPRSGLPLEISPAPLPRAADWATPGAGSGDGAASQIFG